jgi:hypothetical protein
MLAMLNGAVVVVDWLGGLAGNVLKGVVVVLFLVVQVVVLADGVLANPQASEKMVAETNTH